MRSSVCAARGDPVCAANALIIGAEERTAFNEQIWSHLEAASGFAPEAELLTQSGIAKGWWALQAEMLASMSLEEQRARLDAWRRAFPRHPAAIEPPATLSALDTELQSPTHVGLLLPLSPGRSRARERRSATASSRRIYMQRSRRRFASRFTTRRARRSHKSTNAP